MRDHFTQQFLQNTEQERQRIANDLHDSISHELLSLKNSVSQEIKDLGGRFDGIIQEIRTISRNLHPVLFEKVGLKISLEQLIERIQESDKLFVSHEINYEKSLPMEKEMVDSSNKRN